MLLCEQARGVGMGETEEVVLSCEFWVLSYLAGTEM
jgi:hypothetical protein